MANSVHTVKPGHPAGLWDFLTNALGVSRRAAKRLLDDRVVFVNGRRVWMAKHALRLGDRVEVAGAAGAPAAAPDAPVPVLWQDDAVVVADKPAGRLSNEGPDSVEARLREQLRRPGLVAVHRLDRDTSGCLLLADGPEIEAALIEQFRGREVGKVYRALVVGVFPAGETRMDDPVDGRPARSRARRLAAGDRASELDVRIETGRTHQIRKHLWARKFPVAGDKQYGGARELPPDFRHVPRQMLHAAELTFTQPLTGAPVKVSAPLPADYRLWRRKLGIG